MEKYEHFSHQHLLTFHRSLEAAQLICTGCKFPCTDGTSIYSCRPCKFFLHEQCFNAKRSLNHPLHPKHPLSLFQSPTYSSRSFICNLCNKSGSGFCFSCTTCNFDLHVRCAYNNQFNHKSKTCPLPNKVQLKSHPNHPLRYLAKPRYATGYAICNVCGTRCDSNYPLYHCDICNYDAHVECVNLPETVKKEDHPHALSLLHVNPYGSFECDVCRENIPRNRCMYLCKSGCDIGYGMHVKCVSAKVKVQLKSHPNHPLCYLAKPPYAAGSATCNVCGTRCDSNDPLYHCDICNYDAHVECVNLPETVKQEDHPHALSLLHVNPYGSFECDVCRENIPRNRCMYLCKSGCDIDYGMHVKCISAKGKVQLKSHPNHPLCYLAKPPYASGSAICNVCGTRCDSNDPLYHCDICNYDAHVECVNLPETVKREDHPHALSLLHVNPYGSFECDVCRETIAKNHCMYVCKSGCNYGMHVKCVSTRVKVTEKNPAMSKVSDRNAQTTGSVATLQRCKVSD